MAKSLKEDKSKQKKYFVGLRLSFEYAVYAETEKEAQEKALQLFSEDCSENEEMTSFPDVEKVQEALEFKGLCDCCGVELTDANKINDYLCKDCESH